MDYTILQHVYMVSVKYEIPNSIISAMLKIYWKR